MSQGHNDHVGLDGQDLSAFSMLDLFRMEAEGQSAVLIDGLLSLERGNLDPATLEAMMRAAHSIKGAAAIVGLEVVVQLAHAMEDAFVAAQAGALQLTPGRVDVLLGAVDLMVQCARLPEAGLADWLAKNGAAISASMDAIRTIATLVPAPPLAPPASLPPPAVSATPASAVQAPAPDSAPADGGFGEPEPARVGAGAARPVAENFDELLTLASQSRINAHQLQPILKSLQRFKRGHGLLQRALDQLHEAITRDADPVLLELAALVQGRAQPLRQQLHDYIADTEAYERRVLPVAQKMVDEVLALRMRPFRDGVQAFPRMVRDLARSLGKQVQLTILGEDTLVDRDILAAIESPLNHILRNAVDHGMQTSAARQAAGKKPLGSIVLEARHRAGMLSIEISDDGNGVDLEQIRRRVVERNMASAPMAAALSPAELREFLFLPAFSLKQTANVVSGRGVGLDVVQQAIRAQNGSVRIESEAGLGFRTLITLPLTQSIVRALVVTIAGEAYAIPIANIERVLRVAPAQLYTLENKQFFDYADDTIGLVWAAQVLELGALGAAGETLPVVLIGDPSRRFALVVDAIGGEQSLAVQALAPVFGKMRDIASGAVLDDGAAVLILDVPDLLLSIGKLLHSGSLQQLTQAESAPAAAAKRILVVDDSLTVREMERKLLAARGYQVDVAVDGIDGWNAVRAGDYALLITDVDMPRMDGIELVALVRQDPRLHQLPVMIVSYKDRPDDRARGMTAGADYYLTKGSFHDATLIEAVVDLIGEAER